MKKFLLAVIGLGFALAFASTWSTSSKKTLVVMEDTPHYAFIEKKMEKERHHYSRKW